jgi:hypothetical protein
MQGCEALCLNGCLKCCSESELVRRLDEAMRQLAILQVAHRTLQSRYHRRPALHQHQVRALNAVGQHIVLEPELGKAVMAKFQEAAAKSAFACFNRG